MPRPPSSTLTPVELEIMKVLWENGPLSVQGVQRRLAGKAAAYTTVQTMLNLLHAKGKVKRTLQDRAYVYRPAVSRGQATAQTLKDLVERVFGGSAEGLVLGLLDAEQLTPEDLDRVQRKWKEARK